MVRPPLFVAEGFDGIELGGAVGGIQTEADSDGGANDEAGERPAEREDNVGLEPVCDQIRRTPGTARVARRDQPSPRLRLGEIL